VVDASLLKDLEANLSFKGDSDFELTYK
jgi:hypothetical protein